MDFTVTWLPGEAQRFWFWDQSHWPYPTAPLTATLELPAMAEGFTRACRALQRPFPAYHVKVIHGFVYFGFDLLADAAERAAAVQRHVAALAPRITDVMRFWMEEVLPEVQRGNDHMRFADWDARADQELCDALDDLASLRARQWELHDLVLVPAMAALDRFLDLYARHFPDAPPAEAHALLRGLPHKATETARALWRLSRDPEVIAYLTPQSPPPTGMGTGGGGFPHALRDYLDTYGWRTDGWELSDPSFREDPRPVLARLRAYMADGHPDPEVELARAVVERERVMAAARARLPDEATRAAFADALAAARAYPVLSEDHNFLIDQMGLTALRVPLLAMGRRLAHRGLLAEADDVFYLVRDELREALSGARAIPGDVGERLRAAVAARRQERERWRGYRPPATLGVPLPDAMKDDPLYAGFFGIGAEPPAGQRVLRGVGGAPGVAAGPARVVTSLADAEQVAPGDILVCPMTSPAWTPLFATVAAVVADAGGVLSHTAIVAREFGIPCVVATKIACREVRTGEWIEVDGSAGEVRRLSAAARSMLQRAPGTAEGDRRGDHQGGGKV